MKLQSISLESTIRMQWYDKRISLNLQNASLIRKDSDGVRYVLFNRDPVKDIWFPDVFIDKAKDLRAPVYQIPPTYLRIYESGLLLYSARVNYDLSCPMYFEEYPVDEQVCDIRFESWGYPESQVKFQWAQFDININKGIVLNQHNFQAAFINQGGHNFTTGKLK